MAKTKATRRWLTRESRSGAWYMFYVGPKPPRRHNKRWDSDDPGFVGFLCSDDYERFCPTQFHLKPNGGPIEIRLVKVKAVKP